jgi:hypothetical protein
MPLESLLLEHSNYATAGFEQALRIAMHEARIKARPKTPQEPDIVATLVQEGTPYIANTLRGILNPHGLTCTVSSVFCHQRPLVRTGNGNKGCELGDILLVHRHYDHTQLATRSNALLLQAKCCGASGHTVAANEQVQLHLYQSWPIFEYFKTGAPLEGQQRDVTPKSAHSGAQYLLLDDGSSGLAASGLLGWPGTHCMSTCPPSQQLFPYFPFSTELLRFVVGVSGRPFVDDLALDHSNWSQVVWDLLAHGLRNVFNRRRIGLHDQSRAAGDPLMSTLSFMTSCLSGDGVQPVPGTERGQMQALLRRTLGQVRNGGDRVPPGEFAPETGPDEEASGASILLIETTE